MSKAHYTYGKKKTVWWVRLLRILAIMIFALISMFILFQFFRHNVFDIILNVLKTDSRFLFLLLANVFIVGGCILVIIYQWAERANSNFKLKQKFYRSMLVSPDYYRRIKKVDIDQFMTSSFTAPSIRKLQVEHDLKRSSLVTLDSDYLHDEARKTKIAYRDKKLHGVFHTYFSNGNLLAEISYVDGLLHGRSVVYYPNGFLHTEKIFKQGKLDGLFRAWDEEGAMFFEIEYKDDVQHGFDKIYRKNGVIEYEDHYVEGTRVRRKTFDDFGHFKYVQDYEKSKEQEA